MTSGPQASGAPVLAELDLAVDGMTCASCVARVEKRLGALPGVEATVNLALESAHVVVRRPEQGAPVDDTALLAAVSAAGYSAQVTRRTGTTTPGIAGHGDVGDHPDAGHRDAAHGGAGHDGAGHGTDG